MSRLATGAAGVGLNVAGAYLSNQAGNRARRANAQNAIDEQKRRLFALYGWKNISSNQAEDTRFMTERWGIDPNKLGGSFQQGATGGLADITRMVQATLEFNPGQGWFYKYRPALVQGWNFNDQLKTPFSSAISLRMFNHPTGTDQGIFYNASGTVVTEGPASSGKLPTNGWLYEVNDITTLAVFETTQVWAEVGMGQQIAGLSASNAVVPANAYFNGALNVRYRRRPRRRPTTNRRRRSASRCWPN
jgi:hypothetical protein